MYSKFDLPIFSNVATFHWMGITYLNQTDSNSNASQNGRLWTQVVKQSRFTTVFRCISFGAWLFFGQVQAAWFWQISAIENWNIVVRTVDSTAFHLKMFSIWWKKNNFQLISDFEVENVCEISTIRTSVWTKSQACSLAL